MAGVDGVPYREFERYVVIAKWNEAVLLILRKGMCNAAEVVTCRCR